MKNLEQLAELLPDSLTPELVEEIAGVLQDVINEKIEDEVANLNLKVRAFLRSRMDNIQEAALAELDESNEVYRNACLMNGIKSLLTFEVDREDFNHAAKEVSEETQGVEESNQLLAEELSVAIKTNTSLETVVENLQAKLASLETQVTSLEEANEELEAQFDTEVESSDRAIVHSLNEDGEPKKEDPIVRSGNEFLTPEMMSLMDIDQ